MVDRVPCGTYQACLVPWFWGELLCDYDDTMVLAEYQIRTLVLCLHVCHVRPQYVPSLRALAPLQRVCSALPSCPPANHEKHVRFVVVDGVGYCNTVTSLSSASTAAVSTGAPNPTSGQPPLSSHQRVFWAVGLLCAILKASRPPHDVEDDDADGGRGNQAGRDCRSQVHLRLLAVLVRDRRRSPRKH